MNEKEKERLVKVIKNNAIWPLVIEGINSEFFKNGVIVDCKKGVNQLAITIDEKGNHKPSFLQALEEKTTSRRFLVLENLEELSEEEQYSFAGFLKHRGLTGYKLQTNTQIIITVKNADSLSKEIRDLSLIYKI